MALRKTLSNAALCSTLILALGACGFHLRGEIPGSAESKTVYLAGLNHTHPFYNDFSQVLHYSGGIITQKPAEANAVIQVRSVHHLRRPITLSSQGRANTFDLLFRVVYQIETPKGEVLVPLQELEIRRDYFNDQSSPLGQGEEESLMRTEMEKEAAQVLLRRVVYTLGLPSSKTKI